MATLGRSLKSPSMLSTMAARRPAMPGRSLSNLSNTSEVSVASSSGEFSGEDIIFSAKTSPVPQQANPWPIPAKKAMDQHLKLPGMSKYTTLPIFFLLSFGHLESFFFLSRLEHLPIGKVFPNSGSQSTPVDSSTIVVSGVLEKPRRGKQAYYRVAVLPKRYRAGEALHSHWSLRSGASLGRYTVHWVAREGGQASLQLMLPATPEKKKSNLVIPGTAVVRG